MKSIWITIFLGISSTVFAQNINSKLASAIANLETDAQFKHAILSLYVIDSKTGKVVFEKNAQVGLAPASCQKVITSATAFELLGKDFQYKTNIAITKQADDKYDAGSLFIIGSGDPTLGSWRWKTTKDAEVFSKTLAALLKRNIFSFEGNLTVQDNLYGITPLPEGWIWQDIGNYYGAPCFGFNWHENQFDLLLNPGEKKGEPTRINQITPELPGIDILNNITTGESGSGDNGYIYSAPFSKLIVTKGTIPLQNVPFKISGSIPNPTDVFKKELFSYLFKNKTTFKENVFLTNNTGNSKMPLPNAIQLIDSILSPSLDSMNYWFLKRSINLYGEAFLKSIGTKNKAIDKEKIYDNAIGEVQNFWKTKGIESSAINIIDGSGLSPANRVTTNALVTVLQYAKKQNWFASFYYALPELNGIKMKDGYISGVRSYTGYVKSKDGNEYTFSFIVNNFDGSAGTVREKMWKLLDILK